MGNKLLPEKAILAPLRCIRLKVLVLFRQEVTDSGKRIKSAFPPILRFHIFFLNDS